MGDIKKEIDRINFKLDNLLAIVRSEKGDHVNNLTENSPLDILRSEQIMATLGLTKQMFYNRIPGLTKFGMWKDGVYMMYRSDIIKYRESKKY